MKAGIEHASNLKKILQKKRVICAIGDMLELGDKSSELHFKVVNYLKEYSIDFAVLVGSKMSEASVNLQPDTYKIYPNSQIASEDFENLLQDGDIIYFKGSRGTRMEKIIEKLIPKTSDH